MKGDRIWKVGEITDNIENNSRKKVWHDKIGKSIPIREVADMPIRTILGWIRMGWLYHYKPTKKKTNCVCTAACGAGLGHNKQ